MNTLLDDIAAVIGFTATLKLVAWFSDNGSNVYVPAEAVEGQLLVKVVGMPAARLLSREWPREHLAIPKMHNYAVALRRRSVSRRLEQGQGLREIAVALDMSERRVGQIRDELISEGLFSRGAPSGTVQASVEELLGTGGGSGSENAPGGSLVAAAVPVKTVVEKRKAGRPRKAAARA